MPVKALAFDVFGTLLDWRTTIAGAFRESGLAGDPEDLAVAWREHLWPLVGQVNEGTRAWGNFDELHMLALGELLAERGLDLPDEGRQRLLAAWHRLEPWPDVPAGLDELRREWPVAALSNGHVALLVDLARHAGLRFDFLVSAELAEAYKPVAKVYLTAARLLGIAPDELMLVACHPLDLKAARRAGLRSAYVDRPLEYGPGSPAREDPEADISAGDLGELATVLYGTV